MEKTFKKVKVSIVGAMALALGLGIVNLNAPQASAEAATGTFEMKYGASIRLTESPEDAGGIRFETIVGAETYNSVFNEDGTNKEGMQMGMFVVPASYYDDYADYTAANAEYSGTYYEYFSEVKGKIIDQKYASENLVANADDTYTMRMSLVDVLFNNTNTDFVALGYVATTEGEAVSYRYADFSLNGARSMAYVAAKADGTYDVTSYLDNSVLKTLGALYNAETGKYTYNSAEYDTLEEVKGAVATLEEEKAKYGKDYILSNRESYLVKNGAVQYRYLVVPDETPFNKTDVVYGAAETIKNAVYAYNRALLTTVKESDLNGKENGLIYVGQTKAQPATDALGEGGFLLSHDADKDNLHVVAKSNDYLADAVAELLANLTGSGDDYMVGSALKGGSQTVADTIRVNVSKKDSEIVLSETLQGVTALKYGDTDLSFDNTAGLKLLDASTLEYNEQLLTATTAKGEVRIYANVADKFITTNEEFLNLFTYLETTKDETNYALTFDGHIALGADLDFSNMAQSDYVNKTDANGTAANRQGFGWVAYSAIADDEKKSEYVKVSSYDVNVTLYQTQYEKKNVGFIGTFDGQGHTIKGLTVAGGGLFPSVGTNGVIKNVAFADSTVAAYSYFMGVGFNGTMENVLIDVKANTASGCHAAGLSKYLAGTVKESLIYFPSLPQNPSGKINFAAIALYADPARSTSNFWTITNDDAREWGSSTSHEWFGFANVDDFNSSTYITNWKKTIDTSIWDIESHEIPVFKTYNGTNIEPKA